MWPDSFAAALVAAFGIQDPGLYGMTFMWGIALYYMGVIGLPALLIGWAWGRRGRT